jgi:MFS family permease
MARPAYTGGSLRAMAAPFAHRNFSWLWGGSLLSYSAQWIQQAGLGWVVYDITGSGTLVGAVMGVRAIPMVLLAPLAGVAADRYDRRRLLQACQWFAAIVAFAFGAALALHLVSTWTLFAFSLLMGGSIVYDRPARQSSMFELVPRDIAMHAVALNIVGNNLSRVIAPAVAGYLLAWIGFEGYFMVQGALYVAAGFLVLCVQFARRDRSGKKSVSHEMTAGLRYAARNPAILSLFLIGTCGFLLLVPAMGTLFPIYAKDTYGTGPEGVGLMFAAVGLGGVIGAYLAGVLSRIDRQGLVQVLANLSFVVMMLGLAVSPNFAVALVFCALAGASEMLMSTSNMAMMQMCAPENMRGRIASLNQFYPAMISAGGFITGPLADVYGPGGATILAAMVCTMSTLVLYFMSPQLRELRVSDYQQVGQLASGDVEVESEGEQVLPGPAVVERKTI